MDYILVRRRRMKEVWDTKVITGESVAKQHRLVVSKMVMWTKWRKTTRPEKRTKWWKLREKEIQNQFREKVLESGIMESEGYEAVANGIRDTSRELLGAASGKGGREDRETWWWNKEVQQAVNEKKVAKKQWDGARDDESKERYKKSKKKAKRTVAKVKNKAFQDLYERLETKEGVNEVFQIAKQRNKNGQDMQQVKVAKSECGEVSVEERRVQQRWREYFEDLLNQENLRERREVCARKIMKEVEEITEEVKTALKKIKKGIARGPDDIPVEVWLILGDVGIGFLTKLINNLLKGERMPDEWRKSVLIPIYKDKGDSKECGNYRGIKLMGHTMKLWERVVEARLRQEVVIGDQQFGFMPWRSTTNAIFGLRMMMEKWREGQKELHCVFIDLEKAYDRVPREELWECMRQAGVPECYVMSIQDMYEGARTSVRSAAGLTEDFEVRVGLHQGSALSPFLFAIIMDVLTKDVRTWDMMFVDDVVLCREDKEELEVSLERWRKVFEERGLRVRKKTAYLQAEGAEQGTVFIQGETVKKVDHFKYLGVVVSADGSCEEEVRRMQAGWQSWRRVSGVLCDRKLSARLKGKIYKCAVRPAVLYGMDMVAVTERMVKKMEVAELKMVRWAMGVTLKDKVRNEYIWGTVKIRRIGEKLRGERLRWFGHVKRREESYIGRRMMKIEIPGKRTRGWPRRRWNDNIKEDVKKAGVREEEAEDRVRWRTVTRCCDP